ncbi:hypothetical protein [Williamsia herbipolensis]|uniref:hypothetical protein n=1 Tax=Williamsia herbipolensis TaxID=1603258 RepID=UPI0005F7C3F5|nr:hypothetical protein [Williamsia herbipolensis]
MNNQFDEAPSEPDWLEPHIELPSHATMGIAMADVIERITRTSIEHPNCGRLAFDASGLLVDWQDISSDTWAMGTAPSHRVHEFAGGANRAIVEHALRSHPTTRR